MDDQLIVIILVLFLLLLMLPILLLPQVDKKTFSVLKLFRKVCQGCSNFGRFLDLLTLSKHSNGNGRKIKFSGLLCHTIPKHLLLMLLKKGWSSNGIFGAIKR